jgi:uncharacterized protein with GYD domain
MLRASDERTSMPLFLVKARYSSDGIKGVIKGGGTARAEAVKHAIEGLGGTMHSFEFAFGDVDAYVRVEVPDNVAAAALCLAVSSTGLASTEAVVLLTAAEIDAAANQQVGYTPPGG